jgi:hypothetical protein
MNIATNPVEPDDNIPPRFRIPDPKDVFQGELLQHGEWIVANISTNSFWPITSQKVRWRGVDVWILPIMKGFYPAVAAKVPPGKSHLDCEELLMRFLSILSWVEERGFMVEDGPYRSNIPRPLGRNMEGVFSICEEFDLSYFPDVTDQEAMLALALMREGRGLNHVGYAFLSFYRILETAFPQDPKRIAWISGAISSLTGRGVQEALNGIRAQGIATSDDIGKHLYKSGRCAMAHGARKPIIDPDMPGDLRRLSSELPIVRALAVKAIEEVFGVETPGTNYRNHLYELSGFKKILGPDIVAHLQDGTTPHGSPTLRIPDISIRIRGKENYAPLEGLRCSQAGHSGKLLQMCFESPQGDVEFRFVLDFGAERIVFDLFSDIGVCDTGTAKSAERVHEVRRFEDNGKLRIVNANTGELVGRKDAYIPVNMHSDPQGAAAILAHWKALAEQRRQFDQKFADEMERYARGYEVRVTVRPTVAQLSVSSPWFTRR